MNNIFVLDKNYNKIGTLSNQGVKPLAPYFNDLFVQELETGADTYEFSTLSNSYTQGCIEIGNHIMFAYKNRNELFTITSIEHSHNEGYKTVGVYAESVGFELLDIFMEKPKTSSNNSSNGNSGGNSSSGGDDEGGRDNDNDGDDNTDDEYADVDDVYLDENGIIIYDENGGTDYSDSDDVYVDENGVIIYKPKNNKKYKDRPSDFLEFKNISYPTFIKMILKNTGWSYVCQPGLESNKQDMRVSYDTNIYAILQDSMQDYKGVELEFRYEYNNGRITKTVYAYKDGGRGSFIGKRFVYGQNVKGITKTQEVTHEKDDAIIFVDDIGVEITYDVDFALKSAEVPEIEIGDTHYVIDSDFHPPMQIKARIGKIEVSFSDPTRNKIYLANNKKIRGSVLEDELDDYSDSDYDGDYDDDYDDDVGYVPDHDHDRLFHWGEWKESAIGTGRYRHGSCVNLGEFELYPAASELYRLGTESNYWWSLWSRRVDCIDVVESPRYFGYNYHVRYDREEMRDVKRIGNSGEITKQDLLNFIINDLNVYEYGATAVDKVHNDYVDDSTAYFNKKYFGLLSEDVHSNGKASRVGNKVSAPVVTNDSNNDGDQNNNDDGSYYAYNIPALLSCLIGAFQYHVSGGEPTGPTNKDEDDGYDGGPSKPKDPDDGSGEEGPGEDDPSNPGTGSYGRVTCEELRVERADGSSAQANIFGELYVTEKIKCELLMETNTLDVNTISFPDGTTLTSASDAGASVAYITNVTIDSNNHLIITLSNGETIDAGALPTGSGDGTSGGSTIFDTITVTKIQGPDPGEGQYNRVQFEDAICVDHIWCAHPDTGAIHMQDELVLHNGFEVFGDISTDGKIYVNEGIQFADGSVLTSANGSGGSDNSNSNTDNITASKITIGTPTDSKASRCSLAVKGNALVEGVLYIEGSYTVNGTSYSDKSLKENIRYIDTPTTYSDNSLLEKADLHDFIVNQVNICEYNFIDDDRDKIGFIANDYEGTKVGDKIIFRNEETDLLGYDSNNLLFATIGALQEEVRIRDEKIVTLEDRLARIEALLGINNNDN